MLEGGEGVDFSEKIHKLRGGGFVKCVDHHPPNPPLTLYNLELESTENCFIRNLRKTFVFYPI